MDTVGRFVVTVNKSALDLSEPELLLDFKLIIAAREALLRQGWTFDP